MKSVPTRPWDCVCPRRSTRRFLDRGPGPLSRSAYEGLSSRRVQKAEGLSPTKDHRIFLSNALAGWEVGLRFPAEQESRCIFCPACCSDASKRKAPLLLRSPKAIHDKKSRREQAKPSHLAPTPCEPALIHKPVALAWRQRPSSFPAGLGLPQPRLRAFVNKSPPDLLPLHNFARSFERLKTNLKHEKCYLCPEPRVLPMS